MPALKSAPSTIDESLVKGNHADHCEQISDHIALNFEIKRTVGIHAGGHIDLNQPRLQILIDHHVKPIHLETVVNVWDIVLRGT